MAGIELDPVTGGPVSDSAMETSIPGIFAGGNVLHVHDLVDNVSLEAESAGASAADFAMGKIKSGKHKVSLMAGENVRSVIPQAVIAGEHVTLSIRVKEPAEKVKLRVGQILTKSLRVVKPSQMVRIAIPPRGWQKISSEIDELVVRCECREY